MEPRIRRTKLPRGAHFELTTLPPALEGRSGILPVCATLNQHIGEEVILAIFDNTPFIFDIAKLRPFDLHMKNGAINTASGPLIFLLFWLRNPRGRQQPFAMWDLTLNPQDESHWRPLMQLADQSHWHVAIVGVGNVVLDLQEIENHYGLGTSLSTLIDACSHSPSVDFDAAKQEYERDYSLHDLFTAR